MDASERDAWRQADQVFDALLDLPAADRAAHLAGLELPEAVREHVQRLLKADAAAGSPLDRPPPFAGGAPAPDALGGRRFGRWQLERELGRGGMAVVYRAHAVSGATGQLAALKLITSGALALSGRDHFLREQQVLLRLRHPFIAALYDAGIADDGTPWLAMALVDGEPIDAWCDARGLDVPQRVRLVLQVGDALAYAHRNLVIHRDIKPSNVLVDGDDHVRLLDFGIARCTDDADAEPTATNLRALTPGYAAPEQFDGAPPSTAMDVFGLGALLYRLLTGAAPRSNRSAQGAEITLASRKAMQSLRQDPEARRRWSRCLRGDLDAVLGKALAERPGQRYSGIEGFIADLRRWLDGMPVRARPPSLGYRARKFLKRHRGGVAAAAALVLAIAFGVGAALRQADIARQQALQAIQAEARTATVTEFLVNLFEASGPDAAAAGGVSVDALLEVGTRRAREAFSMQPQQGTALMLVLARIHQRLGHSDQARALLRDSRALESPLAQQRAAGHLLHSRLLLEGADSEAAVAAADAGLRSAADLPIELVLNLHQARAQALQYGQHPRQAARQIREALAYLDREQPGPSEMRLMLLTTLTGMLYTDGATEQALQTAAEAWALTESGFGEPTVRASLSDVYAGVLADRGRLDEAVDMQRRSLALTTEAYPEGHRLRALRTGNLGIMLSKQGQLAQAETLLRDALRQYQRLYPQPNAKYGHIHNSLGVLLLVLERPADALPHLQIAEQVAVASFGARDRASLAAGRNVAAARSMLGQHAQARRELKRVLNATRELMGGSHSDVAATLTKMADNALRAGEAQRSLELAGQALAILREHGRPRPSSLLGVLSGRARALAALGRHEQAQAAFAKMWAVGQQAGADAGRSWPRMLATRAAFLARQGSPMAEPAIATALQACRRSYGDTHPATQRMLALGGAGGERR